MILLLIHEYDTSSKATKEGEFDRAWFRLSNDETNQTLDYSILNKVSKPEDYQPMVPKGEEEDGEMVFNPLTYVHGRLYLDTNKMWVFESYKHSF